MKKNKQNVGDGMKLLRSMKPSSTKLVFFDPQHRPLLDRMKYGNEGEKRMKERVLLPQMDKSLILDFVQQIERILRPSGYLVMWVDKLSLVQGTFLHADLPAVDLITWEKSRIGMGYRTRRKCDYLLVMQKPPIKARATWRTMPMIPDVWSNEKENIELTKWPTLNLHVRSHPHNKPVGLQRLIIEATTNKKDLVVDPCAGGYSVMRSTMSCGRRFLGCDLRKW